MVRRMYEGSTQLGENHKIMLVTRFTPHRLDAASLILAFIALLSSACEPPSGNTVTQGNLNTNTNTNLTTNSAGPPPAVSKEIATTPVTLPLLDAMLSDDSFVNEAKTTLQISDDEIQKLRDESRSAVKNLSQEGSDDEERSTRASVDKAKKQVQGVLGQEKAERFISLVQQRWAGQGDEGLVAETSNSVPTDTRIVVNAPAYRMDIFREGKLVKTYKIGIGYPEFPLPTGLRKANTIIFNPTWTPPDEPWVKGELQPGKTVEAGSKQNPLGPIKIPIGLPSLIHGGKSQARLGTFASHGCVGLTNSQIQDFAMEISSLAGKPLTMQDIKNYEKEKTQTAEVKLEQALPIELRYDTIVVEDGKLKIFRDVYERGTNTRENLERVLETFGVSLDNLKAAEREKILAGISQMAINAQGRPIELNNNQNTSATSNSSGKTGGASNSGDGSVTRNIKGKKELVFALTELRGKGYPAPVGVKM